VADVDADPMNPIIGIRSFGTDAERVARHVAAFVEGQQTNGVAATVKHFPGHGATTEDSHVTLPDVTAPLEVLHERELVPFRAAIAAGVQVVMTAHVRYPALDDAPATLSHRILTELLRDELGFDGVVMSDGLDMHAISRTVGHAEGAVRALAAGVDVLCIGGESTGPQIVERLVDAIRSAVRDGRLPLDRLRDASCRVQALAAWTQGAEPQGAEPQCAGPLGAAEPSPSDRPGEEAARRAMRTQGITPLRRAPLVLECYDEPTIAAGAVPWAIGRPLAQRMPGTVVTVLTPRDPDPQPALAAHSDRPVVLSVRGLRRRPWQREVVAAVRARRGDLVVVEHDLPGDAHLLGAHYICTYSGSRVSADVAADVLVGRTTPAGCVP
jgi:beta-N-acetylhexosaminidase